MQKGQSIQRQRGVTPRQARGNLRRKLLIDTARQFLGSQDPQHIRFKEVARQAGVPEGSAYHFFSNKYDLFAALAADISADFGQSAIDLARESSPPTWRAFICLLIDQSVATYRGDPVARKVLLGPSMPNEVRQLERVNIESYSARLLASLEILFDLPPVDDLPDKLFHATTAVDALFAQDVAHNDDISDETVETAKLMATSYLANFLPSDMNRRTQLQEPPR